MTESSDKPKCDLCEDSGTVWYPQGGPWGVGSHGKCPHLRGAEVAAKHRIAVGLRKAITKTEIIEVMTLEANE